MTDRQMTPAQKQLADHLREGGKVYRSKEALEGRGYFAPGIKLILPATVQKLQDLEIMTLVEETEEEEIYAMPDNEPQVLPEVAPAPEPEPSKFKPARHYKEKAAKRAAKERKAAVGEPDPTDVLMWVGALHYPTIDDFIREASIQGISKRVGHVSPEIVPGKSRIFFAHNEGQEDDAVIFGYTVVGGIEMLHLHDSEQPDKFLERDDVRYLEPDDLGDEDERGCGFREEQNALYLVTYADNDVLPKRAPKGASIKGHTLVVFDPPIDLEAVLGDDAKRFRSYKKINGDAVLAALRSDDPPTRPRPLEVAKANQPDDLPEILLDLEKGSRWTDEHIAALKEFVESRSNKAQAFRDLGLATGRSPAGIAYQWQQKITSKQE